MTDAVVANASIVILLPELEVRIRGRASKLVSRDAKAERVFDSRYKLAIS